MTVTSASDSSHPVFIIIEEQGKCNWDGRPRSGFGGTFNNMTSGIKS